jgi:hypothetical protein
MRKCRHEVVNLSVSFLVWNMATLKRNRGWNSTSSVGDLFLQVTGADRTKSIL